AASDGRAGGSAAREAPGAAGPLAVYAASDLAFAFGELVPLFEQATGARVTLVLGSSGVLARQIEHGAPADVFFSANVAFVDDLLAKGALLPATRVVYARGHLALVRRRDGPVEVTRLDDLLRPEVRRVAIANPAHAPYGQAAKEALEAAGLFARLTPKLVYAESVRHALQFVQSGAAEAGLVALSVARAPDIAYAPVDPALHRPIDQAAAVTARSRRPALARAFLDFVTGPRGRPVLERYGFAVPRPEAP
ncbi:MAG TPA: molybdate ABC transporter substrate-binding protein, partial [Thermodesulfobacteriota bacterium]|nr:molybdate ABC transporter substrate-binding protein [Thermodesulfobacteriota bacterium]